ncbi:hypothetical protein [Clostridium minihomine]|uniref:hypothetical protein n=1 Tax=Clostridium minihomine TaxID=2045012 RepID=UPI0013ECA4E7|nr:hypothetical protein [Clostridium minihomine]
MTNGPTYEETVQQVTCGEKIVTIRNWTPVFTAQEREKVKSDINRTLYEVFSKIE